ncbi:MAG: outer membrane protein transport protein, partial [Chitinispirillaceae bacterium]|nr:outer membrane protein transport protein [Chitinispirillaceae bacterium]
GITYKPINRSIQHLILSSDFQYTFSSVWKVINVKINDGLDSFKLVQNWENSYRISLGVEYKINSLWILRSAYCYEKNAGIIETLTPTIPDINSRNTVDIGAQFNIKPNIALHFSYEGIFFLNQSFDKWVYNAANRGYDNMAGTYTFNVQKILLGVDYNF